MCKSEDDELRKMRFKCNYKYLDRKCNLNLQRTVPTKDNIDITASAQSFLENYIRSAVDLVLSSGASKNLLDMQSAVIFT